MAGTTPWREARRWKTFPGLVPASWINPQQALDKDALAASNPSSSLDGGSSEYLVLYDFGHEVPVDAYVTGIEARVAVGSNDVQRELQFQLGNSVVGATSNTRVAALPDGGISIVCLGGPGDPWGAVWSALAVDQTSFALVAWVQTLGSSVPAANHLLYWVETRVTYAFIGDPVFTHAEADIISRSKQQSGNALLDLAASYRSGYAARLIAGVHASEDAGADVVWPSGDDYTGFITTEDTVSVVSDSANDAAAGTGARKVRIEGVDAEHLPIAEDVTLNGVTPVVTTLEFLRVNRLFVLEAGTYTTGTATAATAGANAGTITASSDGAGTPVMATIPVGQGQSQQCVYSVPAGFRAHLVRVRASTSLPTTAVRFDLFARARADVKTPGGPAGEELSTRLAVDSFTVLGTGEYDGAGLASFEPRTDLWLAAMNADSGEVRATMVLALERIENAANGTS